jgi:hypothetical protein
MDTVGLIRLAMWLLQSLITSPEIVDQTNGSSFPEIL